MIKNDYILRLLDDLGRIIAKALGMVDVRAYEEALAYLRGEAHRLVGIDGGMLEILSSDALRRALASPERMLIGGRVLEAIGDVERESGDEARSTAARVKALDLYGVVLAGDRGVLEGELLNRARALADLMDALPTTRDERERLFGAYEAIGYYAKAEDALFRLIDEDIDAPRLLSTGLDFYDRLLARKDADLEAGGLPRDEAIASRDELVRLRDAA